VHGLDQVERGAYRSLGVVLVSDRGAPHGHDGIADELLDRAAVPLHDRPCGLVVAPQQLAHGLGVALL
jgi:hypothetical protein